MVLKVEALTTTFPGEACRLPIVHEVSFELAAGRCLALVGESGCGKSMTALSLMRLVPRPGRIESGRVLLEGRDLATLTVPEMRHVRGHQISMIFQEPMTSLNPVVRVGAQVAEALLLHESVSRKAAQSRVVELFRRVGIPDPEERAMSYPHQLSGGLKQRVAIAMALITRPRVLLADEPTTALDVTIQAQILDLMRELQKDTGTAILLITHDFGVVNQLADEVAVMYAGRIVEQGARETLLSAPQHPYTRGLLRALPSSSGLRGHLYEIPGMMPSPAEVIEGCRFAPRCSEVTAGCRAWQPQLVRLPKQQVACLLREGAAL
jgi:peptide/nickel transport system ATP-binding protein